MAENVEYRAESSIAEYETMKSIKLFDDNEIKKMKITRDKFEYKLNRKTKEIKDIAEYIKYEKSLLALIEERKKSRSINQKAIRVENLLAGKILRLYKLCITISPDRMKLWENYFSFCKQVKFISEGSTMLDKMLMHHGHDPVCWLRAVMWEFSEANNIAKAKNYLIAGIRRHPSYAQLHSTFFYIQLSNNIGDNAEKPNMKINIEQAEIIYENAKKKIHSIDFLLKMLDIARKNCPAEELQHKIINDMMKLFPLEELMWHTLAQRELEGLHIPNQNTNSKPIIGEIKMDESDNDTKETIVSHEALKERIDFCVQVYEEAVRAIKTEKMWSFYINAMIDLNRDLTAHAALKKKSLNDAFKGAHSAQCLSEDQYFHYIENLIEADEKEDYIIEIIKAATMQHCGSCKLWELYMRYYIQLDREEKVLEVFRKATKKLASSALNLWRLIIIYYQTRPDIPNRAFKFYEEAVKQGPTISKYFKPKLVEYCALTKGVVAARKQYQKLIDKSIQGNDSKCLELHQIMANIELMQLSPNVEAIRDCHLNAIEDFGKTQTDVWINYLKFERDHGEAKNIGRIFENAKATLVPSLVDNFISEHSLLIGGVV